MTAVYTDAYVEQFEKQVLQGLCSAGIDPAGLSEGMSLGVAVSGGADSMALLTALARICIRLHGIVLHVVTVNHRIRPEAETGGDVRFVSEYCSRLASEGFAVDCRVCEFENGAVAAEADKRCRGTEEAARFLRYEAFSRFAEETGVACLCLAHNRNDQLETLLMRFLQGSAGSGAAGIGRHRGIFVRPLLEIQRCDIEQYLKHLHISWRTDKTNEDVSYLRNRIRHRLMPYLDTLFPGWQHAVLAGAEKASDDSTVLDMLAERISWKQTGGGVCMDGSVFCAQVPAVRRRLLYAAFDLVGDGARIPYRLVREVCSWSDTDRKTVGAAGISVKSAAGSISVEKRKNYATRYAFFVIIYKSGEYELPFGPVTVTAGTAGTVSVAMSDRDGGSSVFDSIPLPFCIRNRQPDDRVLTAEKRMKSLNSVFSSWHVAEKERDSIPILQELCTPDQQILCICGSICGYENWIVKLPWRD
jgi:tRNA(Ile)-lysidine synthase